MAQRHSPPRNAGPRSKTSRPSSRPPTSRAARSASAGADHLVFESDTELVCRYLPDTTLTYVNDAYCQYFGKTREELLGQRFIRLIPEPACIGAREHVASLSERPRVV